MTGRPFTPDDAEELQTDEPRPFLPEDTASIPGGVRAAAPAFQPPPVAAPTPEVATRWVTTYNRFGMRSARPIQMVTVGDPRTPPLTPNQELYATIAATTLGTSGRDSAYARVIARQLDNLITDQPWLRQELDQNALAVIELTFAQRIRDTASRLLGDDPEPITEDLYRSLYDIAVETQYEHVTADVVKAAVDDLQTYGRFRVRDVTSDDQVIGSGLRDQLIAEGISDFGLAQLERLEGRQRWVTVAYSETAGRLLLEVEYKTGEKELLVDAELDPDTIITNQDQALIEALLALDGAAHRNRLTVDLPEDAAEFFGEDALRPQVRGRQTLGGRLLEGIGLLDRAQDEIPYNPIGYTTGEFLADPPNPGESVADRRRRNRQELIDAQVQGIRDDFDRDQAIVLVADLLSTERGPLAAAQAAHESVYALSDEEFATWAGTVVDEQQLFEALDATIPDPRSTAEVGLFNAAQMLDYYDGFLHRILMTVAVGVEGTLDLLPEELVDLDFRSFGDAWSESLESNRVADYLGIEGEAAAAINFFGSVAVDPFFWWTPGQKGVLQMWRRAMTNPAAAEEAIKLPTTRLIARNIERAAVTNGDGVAAAAMLAGMDPKYLRLLIPGEDGVVPLAAQALAKGRTFADEFDDLLRTAMPTGDGTFLLDISGRTLTRNTADAMARAFREPGRFNKLFDAVRRNWGAIRGDREIRLGNTFLDEHLDSIYSVFNTLDDKPLANRLIRDSLDRFDQFLHGSGMVRADDVIDDLARLRAEAAALKDSTPIAVRRFGALRNRVDDLETRLRELAGRIEDPALDPAVRQSLESEANTILNGADELAQLRRQRTNLKGRISRRNEGSPDLPGLQSQLDEINARIAQIDQTGTLTIRHGLEFDDLTRQFEQYREQLRGYNNLIHSRQIQLARLRTRGSRTLLEETVEDFYWEAGESIRRVNPDLLPYRSGETYRHSQRPLHDWKKVTGNDWKPIDPDGGATYREAMERLAVAPDGTVDEELLGELLATGFGARRAVLPTPASPWEIVAYRAMADPEKWERLFIRGQKGIWKGMWERAHRIWASTLLLNPITAFKSGLDEFFTVASQKGRILGQRGVIGATETGLVEGRVAGPAYAAVGQFSRRAREAIPNPWSQAFSTDIISPYGRTSAAGYDLIEPGKTGWMDAFNYQIHGIAAQDEVGQRVARAILENDPGIFYNWWDTEGVMRFGKAAHIRGDFSITTVTAQTAYESRVNMFNSLVSRVKPGHADQFRQALLRAVAYGERIPAAVARQLDTPLFGRAGTKASNVLDQGFDLGYGRPGAGRGAFMHQQQFSDTLGALWEAKERQGKLLTPDILARQTGVSVDEAQRWLRDATWELDFLMREGGYWTPRALEAVADVSARRWATGMMFQPGAASILGKKAQQFFPFGPAQVDFLSRWGLEYSRAAAVGLNPTARKALSKIPGIKRLLSEQTSFRQLGRTRPVPLNLRLIGHSLAVGGASAHTQLPELGAGETPDTEGLPLWLAERFSFFPIRYDETFLIDTIPQLGPMPSFFHQMLPATSDDDDPGVVQFLAQLRDTAESLFPALQWNDTSLMSNPTPGTLGSMVTNTLIPRSRIGLRGQAEQVGKEILTLLAQKFPGQFNRPGGRESLLNIIDMLGEPFGWNRVYKANLGDRLSALGPGDLPIGTEWDALLGEVLRDTLSATTHADSWRLAQRYGAYFASPDDFVGEYPQHWAGLVESIRLIQAAGQVGDPDADRLEELWQSASQDIEGARAFVDLAADVYFNLPETIQDRLIVQHPEIAVNTVSSYACRTDASGNPYNSEYCTGERLRLPQGEEGRQVLEEGLYQEGWIRRRDETEIARDALTRVADAYRAESSRIYEEAFGKQYQGRAVLENQSADRATLTTAQQQQLEALGINVSRETSDQELALLIDYQRDAWEAWVPEFTPTQGRAIIQDSINQMRLQPGAFQAHIARAQSVLDNLEEANKEYRRQEITRFTDWTVRDREAVLDEFRFLVDYGFIGIEDYNRTLAGTYGPLDWEFPEFPTFDALPESAPTIEPYSVTVIDGDTVSVVLPSAEVVTVRLIGINAADSNPLHAESQQAYVAQAERLQAALRQADSVAFANPDPERWGTWSEIEEGQRRYLMVLYLDGAPVVDPAVFSFRNPRGIRPQGQGIPESFVEVG